MLDAVEAALNDLRMVPCPACGTRALGAPDGPSPAAVTCGRCAARFDVLAEVEVVEDDERLRGNCCSGFRAHVLHWHEPGEGAVAETRFATWAQDHLLLRPGDVVSLLFAEGELRSPRRRGRLSAPLMPLMAANHTRRRAWALVGSAPVATLR